MNLLGLIISLLILYLLLNFFEELGAGPVAAVIFTLLAYTILR